MNKQETFLKTNKLSVLLNLALNDLELINKDPNYIINMEYWQKETKGKPCEVCLAGSVLAKTFKVPRVDIAWLENVTGSKETSDKLGIGEHLINKLKAIDYIRSGDLIMALLHLGHTEEEEAVDSIEDEVNYCTDFKVKAVDIFLGEDWDDFRDFKDCINLKSFTRFYRRVVRKLNMVGL